MEYTEASRTLKSMGYTVRVRRPLDPSDDADLLKRVVTTAKAMDKFFKEKKMDTAWEIEKNVNFSGVRGNESSTGSIWYRFVAKGHRWEGIRIDIVLRNGSDTFDTTLDNVSLASPNQMKGKYKEYRRTQYRDFLKSVYDAHLDAWPVFATPYQGT